MPKTWQELLDPESQQAIVDDPWVNCVQCKGSGWVGGRPDIIGGQVRCTFCRGAGRYRTDGKTRFEDWLLGPENEKTYEGISFDHSLWNKGNDMPVEEAIVGSLTFKELRTKNVKRCEEAFPTCKDWTLADWMNATVGELGELANILKKVKRGDFPMESVAEEVGKEIADVAIYLDLMAAKAGVNLADAIIQKFNEVSDRRNCAIKL